MRDSLSVPLSSSLVDGAVVPGALERTGNLARYWRVASLFVDRSIADEDIDEVTFRFRVSVATLARREVALAIEGPLSTTITPSASDGRWTYPHYLLRDKIARYLRNHESTSDPACRWGSLDPGWGRSGSRTSIDAAWQARGRRDGDHAFRTTRPSDAPHQY